MLEIKLFYDWLETHYLSPRSIALWYGLMFIANRSGWQRNLPISLSTIEARTHIPRASIYREREQLRKAGLIDFAAQGSKFSSVYIIHSLEERLVSHCEMQSETQEVFAFQDASRIEMHSENIYKLNYTDTSKKEMEVGADAPQCLSPSPERKEKSCGKKEKKHPSPQLDVETILQAIDPPWRELISGWLEYKRTRKESYKSELGIRKCLTMLRNLSANNSQTAQKIIDQSIANNWAGMFELKHSSFHPRGQPATGQHIGQIKQPETEDHKNRILEKFGNPKK